MKNALLRFSDSHQAFDMPEKSENLSRAASGKKTKNFPDLPGSVTTLYRETGENFQI